MSVPFAEIQTLDPGAECQFFVVDLTSFGGTTLYLHPGTNQLGTPVVWQGQAYQPFPFQVSGLQWSGKGVLPRPTVTVSNIDGTLGALIRQYDDLVGAPVVYKRALVKHLDAVNFPGGVNPTADPTAHFDDEYFEIEQKTAETKETIAFQLASAMDAQGIRLPRRVIQATVCGWTNADTAICPYVGSCDRLLTTCKTNFGATNPLPFGGFPAANRVK